MGSSINFVFGTCFLFYKLVDLFQGFLLLGVSLLIRSLLGCLSQLVNILLSGLLPLLEIDLLAGFQVTLSALQNGVECLVRPILLEQVFDFTATHFP